MPFSNTWDAAFEAAPADSEDINLGAQRIRAFKVAVRERMQVDHVWEDGGNDGRHTALTLTPQTSAPATSSPYGFLYTQTISSYTELLYKDSAGNIIQFTQGGKLFPFASGNFSIAGNLAVAGNETIGEVLSLGVNHVAGFALFANAGTGDTVLQFTNVLGGTYFERVQATGQVRLIINGAVVQTWP